MTHISIQSAHSGGPEVRVFNEETVVLGKILVTILIPSDRG